MQEEIQNHVERRGKKGVAYERLRVHNGALGAGGKGGKEGGEALRAKAAN